ncbi:MAG TPA: MBL fold metallo-hydrolase [Bacilli bacterium]|nr:MBL fold metallo-hydrolase [Bacilli bacterium]
MNVVPFIYKDDDDLFSNCYVIIDSHSSCVIVDPSCDYDGVINYINNHHLLCRGILLTHAHFDHMRGIDRTAQALKVPLFVSYEDQDGLTDARLNCSFMCQSEVIVKTIPTIVNDQEILNLLDEPMRVIATPFHTKGSVCYFIANSKILFSGDTLFRGCIGRTDLPSSDARKVKTSLAKIFDLPDDTKVYPGHRSSTNIGYERKLNPFIK